MICQDLLNGRWSVQRAYSKQKVKDFCFPCEAVSEPIPSLVEKVRLWCVFTYVSEILIGFGPLVFPNITNLCPNTFYIWWVLLAPNK